MALGIGLAGPAVAAAETGDDSAAGESRTETSSTESGATSAKAAARAEADAGDAESDDEAGEAEDADATDPAEVEEDSVDPEADGDVEEAGEESGEPADDSDEVVVDDPAHASTGSRAEDEPTGAVDDPESETAEPDTDAADLSESSAVAATHPDDSATGSADSGDEVVAVSLRSAASEPTATTATPATTGLADIVSKFLGLLGIGSSAGDGTAPLPAFEFVTVVLGAIRREMDRLFANNGPSAALTSTSQTTPGVLSGVLTATDPEGDRLVYSVVQKPTLGTVTVDSTGKFTYVVDPALGAGTDTFVIGVRDAGFHLISVTPIKSEVPVTVTVDSNGVVTQASSQPSVLRSAKVSTASVAAATTGTIYHLTTSGADIVGFNPAKDKLDLGDVSVHNFIVVDTPEGVGFRNPWSGETAVLQGVSLSQLTIDSFTPVINDHLRQDLSGALAWEQGITPKANTVYARSHEVGQIDRVAFNAATDVVDFRYFGTREQLFMNDTPDGVVISNAGTGQALILQGVTKSQLTAKNFVFHSAQVREDRLHLQLGIGTVPDSQVLPQGVAYAGTNNWPTAAGNGQPPTGQSGTTTKIDWLHGSHTTLNFDPSKDKLDFGWFKAHEFDVTEVGGSTKIAITANNQSYTLTGVAIGELTTSNIVALDDGARTKWADLIYSAGQSNTQPRISVSDGSVSEGNNGTSTVTFTVTLSKTSTAQVTVSYSTSNGTATVAGGDYSPTVGTLTFTPGQTSKTVNVTVNGDTLVELDEQFTLTLSAPVNATIADGTGVGTIRNDDVDQTPSTPPSVSIADLSVTEGNGEHSHFMFVASLSKASTQTVTVTYTTSNGTAIAGVDYSATTGTITFAPGVTSQLVHVDVIGDSIVEPNETFFVTLSNPSGATIGDGSATGTITNDDTVVTPGVGGLNSGNPGDELWGEAFFAPYVDMGAWPVPNLLALAQQRGTSLMTLGFLQATPEGKLAWAGLSALTPDSTFDQAKAINQSIAALQAAGGDVMISLGGASGTSLAQWYVARGLSAQALATAYAGVVTTYNLNRIDFDIEGAAAAEPASIALNAQALKLLQQQMPELEIWYTLPVLPSGLTADGINVVRKALEAGVKLDGVNIMAMDYGESAAPTSGPNAKTMGAYAIAAAESTHAQLATLYAGFGKTFGYSQLGVTPMLGVNDVLTEVFTVSDAQALENFARAKGLGMLSMWSINRDYPGNVGQATTNTSGTTTPAGGYSSVFNDYGTVNPISGPPPAISIADLAVAEGNGGHAHFMFTVTLDKPSTQAVTVRYATSNGTAIAGVDYTASSGVIEFAPGVTSRTVHVDIIGDTVVESNETFTVTLSSPTGATIADGSAVGTITDDDGSTPTPGSAAVKYTVNDNWGSGYTASVEVTAGTTGFNGWTVEFDTPAQIGNIWNAEIVSRVGNHYVVRNVAYNPQVAAGQTLSFGFQASPGGGSATATNFVVNGVPVGQNPTTVPPKVSIADATTTESNSGSKNLVFTVTLDKAPTAPVTIAYATSNGTATAGSDYTAKSGTLTFAAGVTSQQISVAVLGDTAVESNETFMITLSNPNGMTIADGSAIGTITNDDVAPVVPPKVSIADATTTESNSGSKNLVFTVTLDKAPTAPVTIAYATSNGTATAGSDYTAKSGTLTFAAGVTSQQISVAVLGDTAVESNETFTITLSNPNGMTIADGSAIGTITNDDVAPVVPPKVTIADASVTEGNAGTKNLVFTVTLDKAATAPVSIAYATANGTAIAGTDYTATAGTLTFAAGVTSQQISVTILGDAAVEQNETFTLTLSNPSGLTIADGTATGTITNDDVAPTPGNPSAAMVVNDNWGSGFTATVTVTAGTSALNGWTVEFDTPAQISNIWNAEIVSRVGNHYVVRNAAWNPAVAAGKTVTFGFQASGAATATNFTVNGQSAPTQPPTVSVADTTVNESNSGTTQMTFVVTLSKSSTTPVTVTYATSNGTATAGVDYTAKSGTVTFAPGVLTQQIQVAITGDTVAEPNETITLTLSSPTGATISDGSAVGTITNDDIPANVSLSISDASVTEGAPGTGVAPGWFRTSGNQILDSAGNPVQIAGVNWFGMESETFAPHGLWTRGYKDMMNQMAALDFNTIRLAYSSEMLHTTAAPNGIDFSKNPDLVGLTSLQIMDKIVAYAGEIGMRVILDHHRSSLGAGPNNNGLWYEGSYTEAAWIADWKMLAQRYVNNPTVIGADLHNEPHNGTWGGGGATDWAAAAERAGNAVLSVNSNWLIIVEGVETYQGQNYWWGGNLMGVKDRPIVLNVPNRVVYSPHDYPNSVYNQPWFQQANFGAALPDKFEQAWGYIYEQNIAPIYLGEFGTRMNDPKDVIWYEAITSYLSGDFDNNGTIDIPAGTQDMSWTFWSWNPNSTDTGGILADDWKTVNANKMAYLEQIQFDFDDSSPGVLAQFVVSLAAPSTQAVTVAYATSNGTATGGSDYAATTGTLTFAPGETRKTINVVVFGDTQMEGNESFIVTLSSPTGATIADGTGAGTIVNRPTTV
ncbi:Calx-beta domain-containing protein [Mycobacterium sp. 236(2023)]|uniref:Calx-beta domain-containing protein n=1 Tax=Mycobacterium sp. 236(2023) TaxID=3038163 RepID=UPI0024157EE8|nr:Calx-beta domain-containing protein [Mycobacterium sp. 236(2023)]MDG4666483.1 Calx-beta domain-containing protein [Mycobacterium sp. 236(2023)]